MKVVSDSDLIPVADSAAKRVTVGERSDAGAVIVLEVTVIGQLEFSFGFMFCPF